LNPGRREGRPVIKSRKIKKAQKGKYSGKTNRASKKKREGRQTAPGAQDPDGGESQRVSGSKKRALAMKKKSQLFQVQTIARP